MSMSMPESRSPKYEPWPKKPKIEAGRQNPTTDEQAHLEETEETALKAIIWDTCWHSLELCKELSDQLYHSLLDGAAMLVYLLYDKEELYRIGHSHMVYGQKNKFWDELERFAEKGDSVYEVCKWITRTNIDRDGYCLLNECDIADILMSYNNFRYRKPLVDYSGLGRVKSPINDDIQEAIRKAKLCPRLTVDQYTLLLIEMLRDNSMKCRDFLLAKAVELIDIKALYRLEACAIQDLMGLDIQSSAHEEFDLLIKFDLIRLVMDKKLTVVNKVTTSSMPFSILFDNEFDESEVAELRLRFPPRPDVFDLNDVAELRRKAEGSRFINRDHFLWAFDERGCGLRTAFKNELASRMAAEDHPPYHIYGTALRLAKAENEPPRVEHLAFAVIFGRFLGFSVDEVKEMQEDFQRFKTAMRGVSAPKNWFMVPDEWYFRDDTIKVFKERLENGGLWDPFRDLTFK